MAKTSKPKQTKLVPKKTPPPAAPPPAKLKDPDGKPLPVRYPTKKKGKK